jgi:hypothetical protein
VAVVVVVVVVVVAVGVGVGLGLGVVAAVADVVAAVAGGRKSGKKGWRRETNVKM